MCVCVCAHASTFKHECSNVRLCECVCVCGGAKLLLYERQGMREMVAHIFFLPFVVRKIERQYLKRIPGVFVFGLDT